MNRFAKSCLNITIILIALFVLPSTPVQAQSLPTKHVLILHAFTPVYPVHEHYNQGIIAKLDQSTAYKFDYSYEYLDYSRFSHDRGYFQNIAQYLEVKYKNHRPDFIVTEENVMQLLGSNDQKIFPDVPVIIAQDRMDALPEDNYGNHFFVQQANDIENNIELILHTRPKTKKIYMIIGDSNDERIFTERLKEAGEKYKGKVETAITSRMSYKRMLETVKDVEADAAILYFRWLADAHGESYIPEQVIADICNAAKVPVYGVDINFLGSGMVGGYVREPTLLGEASADTILDILNSKSINDVARSRQIKNPCVFDWRQLRKWAIAERSLPENSRIEYREISFWERYKVYIMGGIALILVETLLIFGLLINRQQKRKAEQQLLQTNDALQRLTEKLMEQDKMKDEFLINTSHELQTPLNGIINIAEGLAEENHGRLSQRQNDELQVILAVAKKMSSLIKDIIDLERIKRNELEIHPEVIDLKAALPMAVDVFRHLIDDAHTEIVLDIPPKLPPVLADRTRLIQILYNILGNAVKFTLKGMITLAVREEGHYIRLTVEDTGVGIAKEVQEQLFQAFEQGGESIQRQYGGSGLGLYITRNLIERMAGKILLEWSEVGKGTRFAILLPKAAGKPADGKGQEDYGNATAEPMEISHDTIGQDFVILAVDDEHTNLRVLKSIFGRQAYTVLTASNGQEAIGLLRERRDIDLVLMDVMMPGMSGYEACKTIRESYSLYDLPILMLTVRNTPEDIAAGFEAGANDFVSKPFVAKELRARVATLLMIKKSVQQALKNEMAFLQAQIKPHFLFNALSTIMSFCYTDGEKAGELLAHLSAYLQKSFAIDDTVSTVTIENELELTRAYVEIEKARFGERLAVVFRVDEQLLEQRILPLTIQPLVENAVRHGLMTRKNGGTVTIEVVKVLDRIQISIEDDGIGMETPEKIVQANEVAKKRSGGVGLANIRRRLMNYYGVELCLQSEKNQGTRVSLTIPEQME
ncbi:ABC transporter substrate binding protein [Heliophilum fasciatum]|uniref:Stage 0 sporulation protein A homolog n=1 Tax=Heliophilum fasciatum TaxID=35700 RepID=A0A4R2RYT8_9FIRM|nr:ABC transporter substrate binding protein [Heliophilum fasciatum]MCW2276811.1 signal transduction histidine kinase/DNA-binding NarL/FixJ family response regulator [Heliophilum fasciatum]TCP68728.1 ABC transporter substrate binding protein [Heliophilum fasciatum]